MCIQPLARWLQCLRAMPAPLSTSGLRRGSRREAEGWAETETRLAALARLAGLLCYELELQARAAGAAEPRAEKRPQGARPSAPALKT